MLSYDIAHDKCIDFAVKINACLQISWAFQRVGRAPEIIAAQTELAGRL